MKNLSTKHHVEWGPESGGAMVSCGVMEPGEPALYRLKPGVVIRLRVIDQGASGSGSSSSGNATAVVHAMAMED